MEVILTLLSLLYTGCQGVGMYLEHAPFQLCLLTVLLYMYDDSNELEVGSSLNFNSKMKLGV